MVNNKITSLSGRKPVELRPGLIKTNLGYNDSSMMCHFTMTRGAVLEIHNHAAVQNGFVLKGRLKYRLADQNKQVYETGEIGPGGGYIWDAYEYHSTEALEDAEFIECFNPMRPEYAETE